MPDLRQISVMPEMVLDNAQTAMQAGNFAEASRLYQQALRSNPRDGQALYGLGVACLQAQQFEHAEYVFGELVRLNPQYSDGHCVRGIALTKLGRRAEALTCFERAISLRPDSVEAISNYGTTLSEMGENDRALAELDRALAIDPRHTGSWNNRGNVLKAMKRLEEAVECYSRALESDPSFQLAADNRDFVLFLLGRLNRCPSGFTRQLFDEFSAQFDQTMVGKLNYRGPGILRSLVDRFLPIPEPAQQILDLGCGTGLAALAFSDFAKDMAIDGMDLSPRMLEASRARGIYRELILGDLESELRRPGTRYDLILAADSMVYLGDLSVCFSGIVNRLAPGGHFAFTVEAAGGAGWIQSPSNRFCHSEQYLRGEAAASGLDVIAVEGCIIRDEHSVPVAGFAVALRKSG